MRQIGRLSLLFVALAAPTLAQKPDLNGTWIGEYTDSVVTGYTTLELTTKGETVAGQFRTDSDKEGSISGNVTGNSLSLELSQTNKPCPGYFKFALVFQDGSSMVNTRGAIVTARSASGALLSRGAIAI